jgi:hypothetical protein
MAGRVAAGVSGVQPLKTSLLSKVLVAVIIEREVLIAGDAGEISDRLC